MENGEHLDAVRALRARGVDQAEPLLEHGTPDEILSACRRFDARQGRVGPGWLVTEIRAGHYTDPEPENEPSVSDRLKAQFIEHQARLPVDTVIERHTDLEARLWQRTETCPGLMRVGPSSYPILWLVCSICQFEVGVPVRQLQHVQPHVDHYNPENDPF